MTTTHYSTLAVAASASEDEIRAAFRRLARAYHPDVVGDAGAQMMGKINEAYDALKSTESRAAYDLSLSQPAPEPAVEEAPPAWGTADEDWVDAPVEEPIARDTGVPTPRVVPVVAQLSKRTSLGISISSTMLMIGIIAILFQQWTTRTVSMGNWRLTIMVAVAAALIQAFKREFGWKVTGILALTSLCWPLGALGIWGFQAWSDALGPMATIALTLLGPVTWGLRAWFNELRPE